MSSVHFAANIKRFAVIYNAKQYDSQKDPKKIRH